MKLPGNEIHANMFSIYSSVKGDDSEVMYSWQTK